VAAELTAESVAMIELINAYSVGIVNTQMREVSKNIEAEEGLGTATALQRSGRQMLLTAGHVVQGASASHLQFMPKPTAVTCFGDTKEYANRLALAVRRPFPVVEIVQCEWADLAVLLLDCAIVRHEDARYVQFYKWDSEHCSPEVGSLLHGLGHPVDKTYLVTERQLDNHIARDLGVSKQIISCEVVPNDRGKYIKGFDPEICFLVDYASVAIDGKPHGFSGCGFWEYRENMETLWTVRPRFAGVETSYAESSNLLLTIRPEVISKWLLEIGL